MFPSDRDTLLLLQENPMEGYKLLFDKYWEPLYKIALNKMPSAEEAKDVVQDLFLTLWEKKETIENRESVFPWLLVSLKNRIFNYYAKNESRLRYMVEMQQSFNAIIDDVAEHHKAKELQKIIEATVAALPPRTQQIFRLSKEEEHTPTEIAKMLDLSVQTVKNVLQKANEQVRKKVAAQIDMATLLLLVGHWLEK